MFRSNMLFKKFSIKQLLLILLADFIIGTLFVCLYLYNIIPNEVIFFVVTTVSLLLLMMITNEITTRLVLRRVASKRYKPKRFVLEDFDSIIEILVKNKAVVTEYDFGVNYMLVVDDTAYRVCIVYDNRLYFTRTTEPQAKTDHRLKKCKNFYGYEIFRAMPSKDGDIDGFLNKVSAFTFQTENVCYNGLYYNEELKELVQVHFDELKDNHKENYYYLFELLNCKEIKKENQ